MNERDVVSWTTMVAGLLKKGRVEDAQHSLIRCLFGMWFLGMQ